VGGSAYVYASIVRNDRVLVGVGTGVSVDKPMEDAVATVDARIGELMDALKKISESRTVVESKMQQLSQIVQQEYQRMQQGLK
jgi:prefoldin alpha subunit